MQNLLVRTWYREEAKILKILVRVKPERKVSKGWGEDLFSA